MALKRHKTIVYEWLVNLGIIVAGPDQQYCPVVGVELSSMGLHPSRGQKVKRVTSSSFSASSTTSKQYRNGTYVCDFGSTNVKAILRLWWTDRICHLYTIGTEQHGSEVLAGYYLA